MMWSKTSDTTKTLSAAATLNKSKSSCCSSNKGRAIQPKCKSCESDDKKGDILAPLPQPVLQKQPDAANAPPQDFGPFEKEPECPRFPPGLGRLTPEKPCPIPAAEPSFEDQPHQKFKFCVGSDVLKKPSDRMAIRQFARGSTSRTQFTLFAFASQEGVVSQNIQLACHRANRIARELLDAGVPGEQISIFGMGPTDRFAKGFREEALAENRVVVITSALFRSPQAKDLPAPKKQATKPNPGNKADMLAFAEQIRGEILQRNYRLAADAYMARWTCGKMRTLAEAVKLVHLVIKDKPAHEKFEARRNTGSVGNGINIIELSEDLFVLSDNPKDCVKSRIIDLTFHHMVSDKFATNAQRHAGGIFLCQLAGVDQCQETGHEAKWLRVLAPLDADPYQSIEPDCPHPQPQHQPLVSSHGKKRTIPNFMHAASFNISSGLTEWFSEKSLNKGFISTGGHPYQSHADVTLQGDPSEFKNYEIGFMQTILEDKTTIDYVSGHQIIRELPTPVRDNDFVSDVPPWFDHKQAKTPDNTGKAKVHMQKEMIADVPLEFSLHNKDKEDHTGNVIDTAKREAKFMTFLVARRKGEPLDRFSTIFLSGAVMNFEQDVDVLEGVLPKGNKAVHRSKGFGRFSMETSDRSPDENKMRFSGPTPNDLRPNEKLRFKPPPTDDSVPRISRRAFAQQVRAIANELVPRRKGLIHTPLDITIFFNDKTGRIALPKAIKKFPMVVNSPQVGPRAILEFKHELFMKVRKKDFLLEGKEMRIRPGLNQLKMVIEPDDPKRLADKPGVRAKMREAWIKTENEMKKVNGDPNRFREFWFVVFADKNGRIRPIPISKGPLPKVTPTDFGLQRIFISDMNFAKPDPRYDTVLGSVHTHPTTTPPSQQDQNEAKKQATRGRDHYVIGIKKVFDFKGCHFTEPEKCGNIPPMVIHDRKAFLK